MATEIVPAPERAENAGAVYVAAARAEHLAHCADCRAVDAEIEARAAENAASIARRDRRQLGLHLASTKAVV
ncbi:hypothetical protein [Streptomyces sp. NPDC059701]|uniref:hypothetical protein n=1 Tax=Streptomyces sp. NPDC059701 TaxID=3346914 RepID=UPI003676F48C